MSLKSKIDQFGDWASEKTGLTTGQMLGVAGATVASGGLAGLATYGLMKAGNKKKDLTTDISASEQALRESISNMGTYQVSPEIKQLLAENEKAAASLEEQKGLVKESTDISRNLAGMSEAPGASLQREDIQQATAQQLQAAREAGGGSMAAMGAVSQIGRNEQMALRDLAKTNMQFQTQAESDLANSLRTEAGLNAQITEQQAGLKAQGYTAMAGEQSKAYESQMNKYLTGVQFDTQMLANRQTELTNMQNRRAQLLSSGMEAVASILPAVIGA